MNSFEQPTEKLELAPEEEVRVVAMLDDIGGKRYFLQSENGRYFYLDQDLSRCKAVDESAVASAIFKHAYQPATDQPLFAFKDRVKFLTGKNE